MASGKRDGWMFRFAAGQVANGAVEQRDFRRARAAWWKEQRDAVMREIRESGIEISESVAASPLAAYTGTQHMAPRVMVRADLQVKLTECHAKIQQHEQAAEAYDAWLQILAIDPDKTLELTQDDWQYFFGKRTGGAEPAE